MGKSRHRRDYDDEDYDGFNRADKFKDRRNKRWKKIHDHEDQLPTNEFAQEPERY